MVLSQGQVPTEFLLTHVYAIALIAPHGKWLSSDFHNTMALQRSNCRRWDIDLHGIKGYVKRWRKSLQRYREEKQREVEPRKILGRITVLIH